MPEKDPWECLRRDLAEALRGLVFSPPVACVYNALDYAREPYLAYCRRYGNGPKHAVLLGMNPGPWGMAQTGVPFGEVGMVRDWLGIEAPVAKPEQEHPKRPVTGFACNRSEISGLRLWGWARDRFGTPEKFFERFFVANYCPLSFMEESGRNRTPNTLPAAEREPLIRICDAALARTMAMLRPEWVLGVGQFAADRARAALEGTGIRVGQITHPSPANPRANRGWAPLIEKELEALAIAL